jgi:O-methyltransferase involved in polyketide biosynthesis
VLAQKDVPAAEPLTIAEFRGGVVSHSRSRLESLAATAGWTAAARARETEREDCLFDDPWAAALAGCDAIAAFAHSVSNERSGVSARLLYFGEYQVN